MGTDSQSWHLDLGYDQWTALSVSGPRPAARYKVLYSEHCLMVPNNEISFVGHATFFFFYVFSPFNLYTQIMLMT